MTMRRKKLRKGKVEIDGNSYNIVYTTRDQYYKYREECMRWVRLLGLQGYQIWFSWIELPGEQASVLIDEENKGLRFCFPKYVGEATFESFDISYVASHEAIHALLGRLTYLAGRRTVTDRELIEEEEKVVITLSSLLSGMDWLKGGCR